MDKLRTNLPGDIKSTISEGVKPIKLSTDPLFTVIQIIPELQGRYEKIIFCGRILSLFAILSIIMSMVATVFYDNKLHLQIMGLISLLHIISLILGEINQKLKHRYILISLIVINCLWLGSTLIFLMTYIFLLDSKVNPSKADFSKEIHFHVVVLFYIGIANCFFYLCDQLFRKLIKNPPESLIQRPGKSSPIKVTTAQDLTNIVVDKVIKQQQNLSKTINQSIKVIAKSTNTIGKTKSSPAILSKSIGQSTNPNTKSSIVNSLESNKLKYKDSSKSNQFKLSQSK